MKNIIQPLKTIVLALVIGLGIGYAMAWTAPTALPPDANAPAPVNVGSQGKTLGDSQYKSNSLGIGGIFQTYSDTLLATGLNAKVGIGMTNPQRTLDVNGDIANKNFLLGGGSADFLMRRGGDGDKIWKRALVAFSNKLILNYGNDFSRGVETIGNLETAGNMRVDGKVNVSGSMVTGGDMITKGSMIVTGRIHADGNMDINGNMNVGGAIDAKGPIFSTGQIDARGGDIIATYGLKGKSAVVSDYLKIGKTTTQLRDSDCGPPKNTAGQIRFYNDAFYGCELTNDPDTTSYRRVWHWAPLGDGSH